jgi:hypothetical protein
MKGIAMKKKEYVDKPRKVNISKYIVMALFVAILLVLIVNAVLTQYKKMAVCGYQLVIHI